jgi:two-component system response regulator FixJ
MMHSEVSHKAPLPVPAAMLVHIVDDDDSVRGSMAFMLSHYGFRVETHVSGEAFLAVVDQVERGCILLDICMPVMDGFAVQAELVMRKIKMPLIVMTGHGDSIAAARAMQSGAIKFIEKPYDPQSLLDVVREAGRQLQA